MDEPMLRAWMQESVPPTTYYAERPGRWVAEDSWPSPRIPYEARKLAPRRLAQPGESVPKSALSIQSPLSVGLFAGKWCSFSATPDLPHDQREEDGGSLVFDSDLLSEPVEILGVPILELELQSNKPVALLAVRLSDVAPDGKATRVTYGLHNLTHHQSHEFPELLEPGRTYRLSVCLNNVAHVFPSGHRYRVAISTSYWPLAWPPPEPAQVTVLFGDSQLRLPVRPRRETDAALSPFPEPQTAPPLKTTCIVPRHYSWKVIRDLASDISTLEVVKDEGTYRLDAIGLEVQRKTVEWYTYHSDDFNSVRGETHATRSLKRGDWRIRTDTRTVLTSTPAEFRIQADLDAYEADRRVFCRTWSRSIPRDHL